MGFDVTGFACHLVVSFCSFMRPGAVCLSCSWLYNLWYINFTLESFGFCNYSIEDSGLLEYDVLRSCRRFPVLLRSL